MRELTHRIAEVSEHVRGRMGRLGELDAASQDVVIEVVRALEEQGLDAARAVRSKRLTMIALGFRGRRRSQRFVLSLSPCARTRSTLTTPSGRASTGTTVRLKSPALAGCPTSG